MRGRADVRLLRHESGELYAVEDDDRGQIDRVAGPLDFREVAGVLRYGFAEGIDRVDWARNQAERGAFEDVTEAEAASWLDPEDLWLTPNEAAELSGEAASTWRNRCAGGEVEGAMKKGKQWLLPRTAVS